MAPTHVFPNTAHSNMSNTCIILEVILEFLWDYDTAISTVNISESPTCAIEEWKIQRITCRSAPYTTKSEMTLNKSELI